VTDSHDQAGQAGQVRTGMTRRRFGRMALVALGLAGTGTATSVLSACSSGDDDRADGGLASESDDAAGTGGTDAGAGAETEADAVMYSSPGCGCCGGYADYLGEHGYTVDRRETDDLDSVRAEAGVPGDAAGCHTTTIGDYVVEGHVPVEAVDRLLRERPAVDGISLPGMPDGSPGMSGAKAGAFEVVSFKDGAVRSYMSV
jgi:hypothetical protein